MTGIKHDEGKRRWDLLPIAATEEIIKALEFGASKYGDFNWAKGFNWTRVCAALLRHTFAWMRGEDKDPESGLSHLAHVGCNVLFLLTFVLEGVGEDDRHLKANGDRPKIIVHRIYDDSNEGALVATASSVSVALQIAEKYEQSRPHARLVFVKGEE